jgi:hypothetical protein
VNRAAVLAAAALAAPAAYAQTMSEAARNHVREGLVAFEAERFADAARSFRRAHAISSRPELLFNVARAEAAAGNLPGAIEALTLFRDAGAPGFDREALEQQLRALETQRAAQASREEAARAQNTPAPPPPPEVRTVIEPRWIRVEYRHSTLNAVGPWVTLGVGAAVGIVGIVQGVSASSNIGLLTDVNRGATPWSASAQDARSSAPGQVTTAAVLGGVGGAMVVGGALWLILRGRGDRHEVRTEPVLGLAPAGIGLSLSGVL